MSLLLVLLAVPAALVLATLAGTLAIARRYPPTGEFVSVDGLSVHFHDTGANDAPDVPVVVVHGASGNLEETRAALGPALAGRRVIWLDRPGHGHSARRAGLAAPSAQADVVAGLMDQLGIGRAIVVGQSWGGAVAAAMGVLHPDRVAGLVFVAPATHPWPGGVSWYNGLAGIPGLGALFVWTVPLPAGLVLLRPATRAVFAPDPVPAGYVDRCRIPLVLRPWTFRANCEDVAALKASVTALSPRYPEITAPTVVITGDTDGVVAPWLHSEGLARDIAGAELVVLPRTGHMPHHTRPGAVAEAVERVARRAGEASAAAAAIPAGG